MFHTAIFKKIQNEVFELQVTLVTEPDDSYEVRSSEIGRDSQRYQLALVYHVEVCSSRTILFAIALNLSQIPKVVYQYNHSERMWLNMAMRMYYKMQISWQYLSLKVCNSIRNDIQWLWYLYNAGLKLWFDDDKHHQLPVHRHIT